MAIHERCQRSMQHQRQLHCRFCRLYGSVTHCNATRSPLAPEAQDPRGMATARTVSARPVPTCCQAPGAMTCGH
eukprot:6480405-Lingulodinium_polyedra.AAC.1